MCAFFQTGLRQYVRELPAIDPPELFGQHVNAEIQSQIEEAEELFATLLSIQHPGADISDTGDAETRESRVHTFLGERDVCVGFSNTILNYVACTP